MKNKYINLALIYALVAMVGGIFFREFAKINEFTGATALGKVHTHLFVLGMFVFLLVFLFSQTLQLEKQKTFRVFMKLYNVGLPLFIVTLLLRGILQVSGAEVSTGADAALSGVAGITHFLVATGLVLLLLAFRKAEKR